MDIHGELDHCDCWLKVFIYLFNLYNYSNKASEAEAARFTPVVADAGGDQHHQ